MGYNQSMTKSNQRTLQSYERRVQAYVDGVPQEVSGGVKNWIERALEGLPKDAKIIEIGSASGRDARYIEGRGFSVERTDATHGFVELLKQEGYEARDFNILTDSFESQYDLIFADAVLLHFSREELELALEKVRDALTPVGRFAFSLIQGRGETWSEGRLGAPRYFCYWTEPQIKEVLERLGFANITVREGEFGENSSRWLFLIITM